MITAAESKILFVGDRYIDLINSLKPNLGCVEKYVTIETRRDDMLHYDDFIEQGSPRHRRGRGR